MQVSTRFHARAGNETPLLDAVLGILDPVRGEAQCLSVQAFRAVHDPRLFVITSLWVEESAHVLHRTLPHTREFLERVERLVDEPFESTYTKLIG
ncbi:MAG TPA: antibiotic biosynthesis monooxygenase [Thermoplasmata archaeon]|nr:antibiotic biosynthesis monooxygenase [Thermoplasmata archaeon]